jgi:predicted amidophosphoribosyltransferase
MSVEIHPRKIRGKWADGYALDLHTTSSTFLGYDGYGHPQFETVRSELGELLYKLKYRADPSAVDSIAETATEFLKEKWRIEVDLIVPVPPSDRSRKRQPVLEVATAISDRTGIELCLDGVVKVKQTQQLKNVFDFKKRVAALEDAFTVEKAKIQGKRVLLFDDLFRSGATMNTISECLITDCGAQVVCALTLTRTRSSL